jgi:hypothetical protein
MTATLPQWTLGPVPVELRKRFDRLAGEWKAQTGHLSVAARMAMHPAYQQIIGMGPAVLPLVLDDLRREPHHWFWALGAITGEDPVPPESRGNIRAMADAWVAWGRDQGLIG